MKYISLFQEMTKATIKDCIVDQETGRIIFLVKEGEAGLAIGKGGLNVKKLSKIIGKEIEVVEYADKLEELVKSIMAPARVRSVRVVENSNKKKSVYITVDPADKGLAIGRGGRNVARAKLILKRYYDIDSVVIV
jgi:N utilization substance protein A